MFMHILRWNGTFYNPNVYRSGAVIAWNIHDAKLAKLKDRIPFEATSESTDLNGLIEVEEGRDGKSDKIQKNM